MVEPGICLTGGETLIHDLQSRLDRTADLHTADLHEVRLDLLEPFDPAVFDLIGRCAVPVLATCRPKSEGGMFEGAEADRLDLLRRAVRAGALFVDLELDTCEALSGDDWSGLPGPDDIDEASARLVVSVHDFDGGPGRVMELAGRLNRFPAPFAKLALAVRGAGELAELANVRLRHHNRIIVGMGEAGLWTRVRPAAFGSAWTYVALSQHSTNAPGQVDLERAERLRLAEHGTLRAMALVGGEQVVRSPGPDVYNPVFHARGMAVQYLPLPASSLEEALAACGTFGVTELSVTAPFKQAMAAACNTLDDFARATGVVNTAKLAEDGSWHGWNTDAPATIDALGGPEDVAGRAVLALGSGATAKSVGHALTQAGARVGFAARTRGQEFHDNGFIPWKDREKREHDILVNCTPLGSDGKSTPWDDEAPTTAKILLDVAIHTGGPTPLAARFLREEKRVVSGLDFWCAQGALQMSILCEEPFSAGHLRTWIQALKMGGASSSAGLPSPCIALVGLRGSGKTTVGRRLAALMKRSFIDTDNEVEKRLDSSIATLFQQGRVEEFRKTEKEVLLEALRDPAAVVSTGGGCVEDGESVAALGGAFTIWLDAPDDELLARCAGSGRPPLTDLAPAREIQATRSRRNGLYAVCSRLVVSTGELDTEAVCDVIEHLWKRLQDHDVR
ncbi:MAG: type I 3-dehydroquinate dehydratase [Deltaproteobacteria bacterium]|nr:type I 3-dehydroquinate dehydratase [Deltaproteobacteria bacterium]